MGDFDRKSDKSAEGNQTKQVMILVALGVVLIGVVGYHFMSKGPQAAMASGAPVGVGVPMPIGDETPEQASNALRQDPTAALLRHARAVDTSLDAVPRNPFRMSDGWRAALIQQVEPVETPVVTAPVVTPRHITPRVIPAPKAENFKLGSIMRQGGGYMAIINGRIVSPGSIVGDARVIDIQSGRVILAHAQHPDGPKLELTMEPKFK